ncbi:MAG: hypothetical protein WD904_05145 [Dehalococcoidia bacterium]
MRIFPLLALCLAALAVAACGDDDDAPELAYETFAPDTFAYIDGREDDVIKYPTLEIWDQPECNYDRVLGNITHGTKVRVIQKKTGCNFVEYEVEFLEGDQVGQVGWIRERYLLFGDEPPPTAEPTPTASPSAAGEATPTDASG